MDRKTFCWCWDEYHDLINVWSHLVSAIKFSQPQLLKFTVQATRASPTTSPRRDGSSHQFGVFIWSFETSCIIRGLHVAWDYIL